jgi:dihydroorotase
VLIESGKSNWQRLAEVMSLNPAKIAGDSGQGEAIAIGAFANLALIDPKAKRIINSHTASKSVNNPYAGLELPGAVVHTVFKGRLTVTDGKLVRGGSN